MSNLKKELIMKITVTDDNSIDYISEVFQNIKYQLKNIAHMDIEILQDENIKLLKESNARLQRKDKKIEQLNRLINMQKNEMKCLKEEINTQKEKIEYLNIKNEIKNEKIRKLNIINEKLIDDIIQILYKVSELKDYETYEHTVRVGWLSRQLAEHLGLDKEFVEAIGLAAPLHDIGKISIPDSILLKPGKLDDDEFEIMKKHTIYGYELLKNNSSPVLRLAAEIALTHHERWDGSGYPRGLKGEEIPISAQIVGVVDSFDAMVSDRPYKKAKSYKEAFKEIEENSGKLYSPKVAKAFLTLRDKLVEKAKFKQLKK